MLAPSSWGKKETVIIPMQTCMRRSEQGDGITSQDVATSLVSISLQKWCSPVAGLIKSLLSFFWTLYCYRLALFSWRPLAVMFNSEWAPTAVAMITIIIIITTPIMFKWSPPMQAGLAMLCVIWPGAHCEVYWTPGGKLTKITTGWEERLHLNMTRGGPFYAILNGLTEHSKKM